MWRCDDGWVTEDVEVPPEVIAEVRSVCLSLPEAYEEQAWVGRRWRIRRRTFAHVLTIDSGWPPAYARAAGDDGPICVMTFGSRGAELEALRSSGHPLFAPVWRADEVGMVLDEGTDWEEVAELITESYCILAPRTLGDRVNRPSGEWSRAASQHRRLSPFSGTSMASEAGASREEKPTGVKDVAVTRGRRPRRLVLSRAG